MRVWRGIAGKVASSISAATLLALPPGDIASQTDLVATHGIRHVDFHRLLVELRLVSRVAIMLEDELLVE